MEAAAVFTWQQVPAAVIWKQIPAAVTWKQTIAAVTWKETLAAVTWEQVPAALILEALGALTCKQENLCWIGGSSFGFRNTKNMSCFKSVRTFSDKKVVTSEKRRIDKMFCEQEKSVTLTKNTIGWSEDSYREGLRRGKFMQMKQEIQFVCVKKSSVARCERNQLLM